MIIRNNCFETNSSSTHAFCIGQGLHLQTPYELLNDYRSGSSKYDDYEYSFSSDNLLSTIDKKSLAKFMDKADSEDIWKERDMYIILSRYKNLGRVYKRYDSFHDKLNFIWTCLIVDYNRDDYYIQNYQKKYNLNIKESFYRFLGYLTEAGFKIFSRDIIFKKVSTEAKDYDYNKPINLGITNKDERLPKEWQNKKMIGIETYGYYPIYEICKILKDPLLFWNLVLGNSIIYTGSDEEGTFDNFDFSSYKVHLVGGSDWGSDVNVNHFRYEFPDLIGSYINGNYETKIYSDGTRTRELIPKNHYYYENGIFKNDVFVNNEIDIMKPVFPESIDLKITNKCKNNCSFCYANSSKIGMHGDKLFIKKIISQMHPFTEVAIGGGNPLEHPDLIEILEYAKERNIICNITLKDIDIINNIKFVNNLYENNLIFAVGVSPTNIKTLKELRDKMSFRFNFILHLILGIHSLDFIKEVEDDYYDKILILGYKNIGNGNTYFVNNKELIEKNIKDVGNYILNYKSKFKTNIISFDNLAIQQLNLYDYPNFKQYYQGNDGNFSFYIDAVNQTFARSSIDEAIETFGHRDLDLDYYFNKYIREE